MEILIWGIVIYVIYYFIKGGASSNKEESNEYTIRYEVSGRSSYDKPKGKPAKWIGFNESIKIQGYDINNGLLYVGEKLLDTYGYENDACLIHPKSKVSPAEPWQAGDEMGYWPKYVDIPKKCRGAYLKWLSTGRDEPETYIGYVFLYFYGLERRLLIDGQKNEITDSERNEIINEVRRLLTIYGENRSFRGYANNFLAMEWVLYQNDKPIPDYIDFNDRYCSEPFQVVLAKRVNEGKPITSDLALQWVTLHPEFGLRTPARRCAKEFRTLFKQKYTEKYGDGLVVKPNKTPLSLEYRAASPSLRGDIKLNLEELPNPFILSGPVKKFNALVEECTTKLESYSRYLGRKDNNPNSMTAYSLLPKELLSSLPRLKKAKDTLLNLCGNGTALIEVEKFYKAFGEQSPLKMGKKDSETLANFLEGVGIGVAPDVRFHNIKPTSEGKIAIFPKGHGIDFHPSKEFRTIGTILRLGSIVSQIDDDVSSEEESTLESIVKDNRELTQIEKDSLLAFLHWCLNTPQNSNGLKQRLTELSPTEKTAISHILITVVHADGRIDPREVKQLEKLYTTLGLGKEQVTSDLHLLATEPVTVAKRDADKKFSIPTEQIKKEPAQGFSLNEELIRIREEETQKVKGVLESIFTEEVEDDEHELETIQFQAASTMPIDKLDEAHQNLFHRLVTQETWKREAFHEVCKELELMVDGAMEVINEWAFDIVNAPLIDDGEPIYIDLELAKEITNA